MNRLELPYDGDFDPPAPVAELRIGAPGSEDRVLLRALVDTGADATVIPTAVVRRLALPLVDRVAVEGVGGRRLSVGVYAASARIAGLEYLVRVVALGHEALVGRDLLNRLVARLDGPGLRALMRAPAKQSSR